MADLMKLDFWHEDGCCVREQDPHTSASPYAAPVLVEVVNGAYTLPRLFCRESGKELRYGAK